MYIEVEKNVEVEKIVYIDAESVPESGTQLDEDSQTQREDSQTQREYSQTQSRRIRRQCKCFEQHGPRESPSGLSA